MAAIKSICVYCGSQPGLEADFALEATILGREMASNNIRLVYGGGSNGIMGAVSLATQQGDGHVLGIIPDFLLPKEGQWDQSSEKLQTFVTKNMHERKQKMFEESDAFIALPGGMGTLEEIVEMITWAQLGRHDKPIAFLNTNGFWDPMLELIDHMREAGFIHTASKVRPIVIENAMDVIPSLQDAASQ